ncbi:hypothetical protein O3P69_003115 [Scylla paramamosain]|uniref:Uncharacterized protein n=1 Tax=Scylla paramamosain TaxID=85552 RepID=A0AAW0ULV4_SCYPA
MHIKLFRPLQSGYKRRRINTAYLARPCSADRPTAHLRPTSVQGEGRSPGNTRFKTQHLDHKAHLKARVTTLDSHDSERGTDEAAAWTGTTNQAAGRTGVWCLSATSVVFQLFPAWVAAVQGKGRLSPTSCTATQARDVKIIYEYMYESHALGSETLAIQGRRDSALRSKHIHQDAHHCSTGPVSVSAPPCLPFQSCKKFITTTCEGGTQTCDAGWQCAARAPWGVEAEAKKERSTSQFSVHSCIKMTPPREGFDSISRQVWEAVTRQKEQMFVRNTKVADTEEIISEKPVSTDARNGIGSYFAQNATNRLKNGQSPLEPQQDRHCEERPAEDKADPAHISFASRNGSQVWVADSAQLCSVTYLLGHKVEVPNTRHPPQHLPHQTLHQHQHAALRHCIEPA